MAFSFANKTRYEQSYTLVDQSVINDEEAKEFEPNCLCIHGTYGKTFKFFAKRGYAQYVSCNPATSAEVGKYYSIYDVVFQTLERDGKTIDRAMLKKDIK